MILNGTINPEPYTQHKNTSLTMKIENNEQLFERAEKITCVSDYLDVLQYIRKDNSDNEKTYFFRGNANTEHKNIPSIFREKENFIESEKEIYFEMISRCPQDFAHCKTALDHLVMMQHYTAPTRLLDLSENPLVALYFACEKYESPKIIKSNSDKKKATEAKDGKVSIFHVPTQEIKNFNSDTAALLANLAKIDSMFNVSIMKFTQFLESLEKYRDNWFIDFSLRADFSDVNACFLLAKRYCEREIQYLTSTLSDNLATVSKEPYEETLHSIDTYLTSKQEPINNISSQILDTFLSNNCSTLIIDRDLQKKPLGRYIHFIKEEKPYFDHTLIKWDDVESVICVRPKQDNPHIIRQSGAFFLFGVAQNSENKLACPPIPDDFNVKIDDKTIECIIPKESKQDILDELKSLSISKGHLFTDIDKVAEDVKLHHQKTDTTKPNKKQSDSTPNTD